LEQVAYALLCMDTAQFGQFAGAYARRDPSSEFASAFSALSVALSGDLRRAESMVGALDDRSPGRSLISATKSCAEGSHEDAGELVEPWTAILPGRLGPPTAAAAFSLVADERGDVVGGAYWSDLLCHMLPHGTGALSLRATFRGRSGDKAAALEQSRRVLLAWPQNAAYRGNFLKWADAVGDANLGESDRALARFLRHQGPPPDGPAWSDHPASVCSCETTLCVNVSAGEQIATHLEMLLSSPIIAARCRQTGAAWLFAKMMAGSYRGVRLVNVRFSDPRTRAEGPIPALFS